MIIVYFISCLILAISYIGLIHFYVKGWLKTPHQNTKKIVRETLALTIVVSVRNESKSIRSCIESIIAQQYPRRLMEVILVNDFSTDDTLDIIKEYSSFIRIINLSDHLPKERENFANKKQAITEAVEQASHSLILCGDGDCFYGDLWVTSMIQYYEKYHKKFVTGPIDFIDTKSIWQNFLCMDLIAMNGVTAGSIGQKKPVMASGANMLFEKESFLQVNGYAGNEQIASGDDIFLMQKIFMKDKKAIGFVKNRHAMALTRGPQTISEFIHQRIRWTSKSGEMVDKQVWWVLLFNYFFYLTCFLNLFVLPWLDWVYLGLGLMLLGLKILIDSLFFKNILAFYSKSSLFKWILPLEILHIIYVSLMGVLAIFGQYKWKGRSLKK